MQIPKKEFPRANLIEVPLFLAQNVLKYDKKKCNLGKLIRKKEKFPNTLTIFPFFSILCDSGANQVYVVIFKTFLPTQ